MGHIAIAPQQRNGGQHVFSHPVPGNHSFRGLYPSSTFPFSNHNQGSILLYNKGPNNYSKAQRLSDDGKTCLADNLIEMKSADGADACNDECKKTADSKCKFWTYVPTRKICFILSGCVEKTEEGSISGENGCVIPSSKLSVFNLTPKTAKTIKIEWENSVCANEEIAELETLKNKEVKYFEKPDSLKCGKMKKVSGNMDAEVCTALENAEPADIYTKTQLADPAKCEIATTPKTMG